MKDIDSTIVNRIKFFSDFISKKPYENFDNLVENMKIDQANTDLQSMIKVAGKNTPYFTNREYMSVK